MSSAILLLGWVSLPLVYCLGFSLYLCPGFPFCDSISIYLAADKGTYRVSQVLDISLLTYHVLRWTPTDPPHSYRSDWFVLASVALKMSPSALSFLTGLYQTSGMCDNSLWSISFSVYASCGSFCEKKKNVTSYMHATLDTGGWLDLPRQGLSPCKRCQALLGAPRLKFWTTF